MSSPSQRKAVPYADLSVALKKSGRPILVTKQPLGRPLVHMRHLGPRPGARPASSRDQNVHVRVAVTIMVGLGFATILTLVIVPVLYAIFFQIPYGTDAEPAAA